MTDYKGNFKDLYQDYFVSNITSKVESDIKTNTKQGEKIEKFEQPSCLPGHVRKDDIMQKSEEVIKKPILKEQLLFCE